MGCCSVSLLLVVARCVMGTLLRRSLAAESWLSNVENSFRSDEHFDLVCYGNLSNVENSFSTWC